MAVNEEAEKNEENTPVVEGFFKKVFNNKRNIIIVIIILVLIIATALYFVVKPKSVSKTIGSDVLKQDNKDKQIKPVTTYFDLNEFLVNLDKGGKQPNFLKISVTLQLPGIEMVDKVKNKIPVIRDAFQVYLRELRADDLRGSAGIYRLREELLLRINYILAPDRIDDILFREILVQ